MVTDRDEAVGGEGHASAWSRPRRPVRTLTLASLVVTAVASLGLAVSLYPEARYAFEGPEPIDVGALAEADLPPSMTGRFVRATVSLEGRSALEFHRLGESGRRIVLAADGPRFVDHAVPDGVGGRFVPPRLVAGRLARVGELGLRHRGLSGELDALAPGAATRGWVLIDGDEPRAAAWVAALEGIVLAFFVFAVGALVRILRKAPAAMHAPR